MRYVAAVLLVGCGSGPVYECTKTADCPTGKWCQGGSCQFPADLAELPDLATTVDLELAGCARDVDCKGQRICINGDCVDPPDMLQAPDLAPCSADTETDVDNCGKCGNACAAPPNGAPTCVTGKCALGGCDVGYADCNGNLVDGCEENTASGIFNCGGCGKICSTNNVNRTCGGGVCNGTCLAGYADCNSDKQVDGCEINVNTDGKNCGSCGKVCGNGTTCQAGVCK